MKIALFYAKDYGRSSLKRPTKSVWQDKIFIFMARNANDASSYFRLPPGRVIEVGSQITV